MSLVSVLESLKTKKSGNYDNICVCHIAAILWWGMFIRISILIWDTHSLVPMVTIFYGYQTFKPCDQGDTVKESVEFDVGL